MSAAHRSTYRTEETWEEVQVALRHFAPLQSRFNMASRIFAGKMSRQFIPTIDPNANKNRIPTESELSWMSKTAESLSISIRSIEDELKEAEAAHNALTSHQQRLLQELEGVQSQIHSSKSIMEVKRRQCASLAVELKKIANLRHPVRRIPFEVLQCIFERASGCFDPFPKLSDVKTAIKLSHVCHRWRSVAVDTPRMWSSIAFSFWPHRDKIGTYWRLLTSRVKHVPATISIYYVDMQSCGRLTACKLPQFQEIKSLTLHLKDPRCFDQLCTLPSFLPQKGVETLTVEASEDSDSDNEDNQEDIVWDLGALTAHLPPITSLRITSPYKISVTPPIQLEATTSLNLINVKKLDIPFILSLMTNLLDLQLQCTTLVATQQSTDQMSCHLRKFVMYECRGDCPWLSQISFPSLTTLIHDRDDISEQVIPLIQNHKSITTVWALKSAVKVSFLASTSPQLQSLGIGGGCSSLYKCKIAKIKGTPLPKLKEILLDARFQELALTDFEGIVKARCLLSDHPDSKIMPSLVPLQSLTILRSNISPTPEAWRDSEFFHSATLVTTESPYYFEDEHLTLTWA